MNYTVLCTAVGSTEVTDNVSGLWIKLRDQQAAEW